MILNVHRGECGETSQTDSAPYCTWINTVTRDEIRLFHYGRGITRLWDTSFLFLRFSTNGYLTIHTHECISDPAIKIYYRSDEGFFDSVCFVSISFHHGVELNTHASTLKSR